MSAAKTTIQFRLSILCGVLCLALIAVGGVNLYYTNKLSAEMTKIVEAELPAVHNMTLVDMMHDGIRGNVMAAIVYSESNDYKGLKAAQDDLEEMNKKIEGYLNVIDGLDVGEKIKVATKESRPDVKAYVMEANQVMDLVVKGKLPEAKQRLSGFDEKFDALEKSLGALGEAIEKEAESEGNVAHTLASASIRISVTLLLVGLVSGLATAVFLGRSLVSSLSTLVRSLQSESERLDKLAKEMSQSSAELSESSAEQASAVQETAASLEEIGAMVKKTEENADQLGRIVEQSYQTTSSGKQSIKELLSAIQSIEEANKEFFAGSERSNQEIAQIVKVISEIGEKTKVINDIVFQTKLLSFNASVEAARAGEHGKGFAVVAEEVGNLAQMSGNAAKEIGDMLTRGITSAKQIVDQSRTRIESMTKNGDEKVRVGVTVAQQCDRMFDDLSRMMTEVNDMTKQISTAIEEQSQGVQEISKATHMFNTAAQKTQEVSGQSSGIADELLSQAGRVDTLTGDLSAQVGLNSAGGPAGAEVKNFTGPVAKKEAA